MTAQPDGSRKQEDVPWQRRESQGGAWPESDEEEDPPLYRTDEFRIRVMKVLRCSKKYCHDWTRCPFAHPGEKATRRDPMLGIYTGIACPEMKRDQRCPRGQYCPYAHNVFEYWLHPTRYRTALCRDMENCTRKICFFAHEVGEIRTHIERPYVSPEQLVAATKAASQDPRVQAEYKAAGEDQRRSSKQGLMTGLFNSLDSAETEHSSEQLPVLPNLSLHPPQPSDEAHELQQAMSSLMRGNMGPLANPYTNPSQLWSGQHSNNFPLLHTGPGLDNPSTGIMTGPGGLPLLDQRIRRISSEPTSRHNQRNPGQPSVRPGTDAELLRQVSLAQSTATIDELAPMFFNTHLNTMPHTASHQSRGSQQNYANAAAHLMMDPAAKEPSIWSTPISPLDQLYSTTSTSSDRQSSLEAQSPIALEAAFRQKMQKRMQARDSMASAYRNGLGGLNPFGGLQSGPLNTETPLHSNYGNWALNPNMEFAQAIQQQQQQQHQQQQMQSQAYWKSLHDMRLQQQQAAYAQKQQALQAELRNQQSQSGMAQLGNPPPVETGFDLRFGGLGENQGLFAQQQPTATAAAHPSLLHTTFFTAPRGIEHQLDTSLLSRQASSGPDLGRAGSQSGLEDERSRSRNAIAERAMTHSSGRGHDSLEASLSFLSGESKSSAPQSMGATINA